MRNFNIQLFELQDGTYKILLSPSGRGAQGTKDYSTKEAFASDLKKYLGYADRTVEAFFSDPKGSQHNVLQNHPLTDEVAAYLGWRK